MAFNSFQLDQMIHQMTMGMMIYAPKSRGNQTQNLSPSQSGSMDDNDSTNAFYQNEYIQMLLMPLMMTMIGACITYLRMNGTNIFYTMLYFFYQRDSKTSARIDFEGRISKLVNRTKIEFDMGMGSVFYYIFDNFNNIKGLKYLKRIPDKNRDDFYESCIFSENVAKGNQERSLQTQFFEEFFLAQTSPIYLPNGIKVIPETSREECNGDESSNKKKKMGTTTNYLVSICYDKHNSLEKNMTELLKIYGELKQKYLEFKRKDREDPDQYIYTFDSKEDDTIYFHRYPIQETKTFSHLYFEGKSDFIEELNRFQKGKESYRKRGKAWRKSILAYGEPGCGKTSLLMCLLNYMKCSRNTFQKQLIHLKLDKLSRKNLMDILFQETLYVSDVAASQVKVPFDRRIYVIEEIDGYEMTHTRSSGSNKKDHSKYKKMLQTNRDKLSETEDEDEKQHLREISSVLKESMLMNPKDKDNQLQIQDLLEALDGIPSMQNGEIIFMTTNHIEKIDPALKREGRVNHLMEFKRSRDVEALQFIESFYGKNPKQKSKVAIQESFAKNKCQGWTPAFIESVCENSKTPEAAITKLCQD